MEEGAQIPEVVGMIPIGKSCVWLCITGDPCQLRPPIMDEEIAREYPESVMSTMEKVMKDVPGIEVEGMYVKGPRSYQGFVCFDSADSNNAAEAT